MRYFLIVFALVASGWSGPVAQAGLILQFQTKTVAQSSLPTTVGIDVSAYSDSGPISVSGFDLLIDLKGPGGTFSGAGLPPGFAPASGFISNPAITTGTGTALSPTTGPFDSWIAAGGSPSSSISISTNSSNPTNLFTLNYNVAGGTGPGLYALSFVNTVNDPSYVYDSSANEIAGVQFLGGGINITAVPEPSSMVLATLAVLGGAGIRRRFRKKLVA
ncbi:MAG: PEP-CTERM sorting domain-containing protein [Planctomycetota bacterium]|nr:PEP-CTERM sorting domain-containing protein [Planctomycetota bacterium]